MYCYCLDKLPTVFTFGKLLVAFAWVWSARGTE
jgi:hypothetical protein